VGRPHHALRLPDGRVPVVYYILLARPEPTRFIGGTLLEPQPWSNAARTLRRARVRLTSDLCCTSLQAPDAAERHRPSVFDVFWKDAELDGEDIVFEDACYDGRWFQGASLVYVRLGPIDEVPVLPERRTVFPMTITEDGHGIFARMPHQRPEDILESYEAIPQDAAVRVVIWNIMGGDACHYPTRVGQVGTGRGPHFASFCARVIDRTLRLWMTGDSTSPCGSGRGSSMTSIRSHSGSTRTTRTNTIRRRWTCPGSSVCPDARRSG